MTRFLLDRDVMSQLDQPDADRHENVRAWLASVMDHRLAVSAITVMEAWRGLAAERRRLSDHPADLLRHERYERAFERLMAAFADRVVPVDEPVARLWGELLGRRDKNRLDAGLAATAIVHGLVVATRNIHDFTGRGASVVDPFRKRPIIRRPDDGRTRAAGHRVGPG